MRQFLFSLLLITAFFCFSSVAISGAAQVSDHETSGAIYSIVIHDLPSAESAEYPEFRAWLDNHPRVRAQRMTSLKVSSLERGGLMMAIAGGTAPDILRVYHHEAKAWVRNGFFAKLDKYIYRDTDGDGRYTHGVDEVIWKPFLKIPDQVREQYILENGHIYYLPRFQWFQFLIYRRDIFAEVGLDPNKRFETFEEMKRACQVLTDPHARIPGARLPRGRKGMGFDMSSWMFQGYLYAMGARSMKATYTCPECSEKFTIKQGEILKTCPHCGHALTAANRQEQAAFNTPEGYRAMKFYQDLMWEPFVKSQYSGEPVVVGKAGEKLSFPLEATCPTTGKKFTIKNESEVIEGSSRRLVGGEGNWKELWANGETAIAQFYNLDWIKELDVDPSVVGIMPLPEGGGASAYHYYGIYKDVNKRYGEDDRETVCAAMILDYVSQFYAEPESPDYLKYHRDLVSDYVNNGFYGLCTYDELRAAGLKEYAKEIPPGMIEMQRLIRDPQHYTYLPISEGYSRVQNEIIGAMLSGLAYDPHYDIKNSLKTACDTADTQVFMKDEIVRQMVARYRFAFLALIAAIVALVAWLVFKMLLRKKGTFTSVRERRIDLKRRLMAVMLLIPGTALILLWSYYPLLRGSVMAFQEVRVLGDSRFVGIENFIRVVTSPLFWGMMKATVIYVFAILSLGFIAPILLAVLLSEVKRGSIILRSIYYAPHLLGGVVVLFIWKIFYMPTDEGMLNQLVSYFGIGPVRWLQNPTINKWALAIPGIWAGTGSACLVYLAALKGIDDAIYEAADIDGAGALDKILHITLPSLKPLLIINFVGAFIGAFHSMANVLVLTGGSYETNVIGLQIFKEAFSYLRFGSATALAWILGSILIGFTIYQLSFLKKVEFRRAQ